MLKQLVKKLLNKKNFVIGDKDQTLTNEGTKKLIFTLACIISKPRYGNRVGIYLPRNYFYVASILSTWLSNKCFIPLNQTWPKKYVLQILKDSEIKSVVTNKKFLFLKDFGLIILNKNILNKKKARKIYKSNNKFSYIIYTSGSTGKPKGVQISNSALENYIKWLNNNFKDEKSKDLSLLITGEITFDIIIADLSFALSRKASIFITPDNKNVLSAINFLNEKPINIIYTVPSFMEKLILANAIFKNRFKNIKYVFCGGEVFKKKLFHQVKKIFQNSKIFNMYGPTECTMNCLSIELSKIKNINKFKILPTGKKYKHLNYKLLKNNKNNNYEGELHIGGNQLMDGYLNHKDNIFKFINKKKFFPTGDYFKQSNNILFFQGRINGIKKISGHRLNLGYIEEVIEKIDIINVCKIIIKNNNIICFVTSKLNIKKLKIRILSHCIKKLPNYMIPNKIIKVQKFDYNERGKLNLNILSKSVKD